MRRFLFALFLFSIGSLLLSSCASPELVALPPTATLRPRSTRIPSFLSTLARTNTPTRLATSSPTLTPSPTWELTSTPTEFTTPTSTPGPGLGLLRQAALARFEDLGFEFYFPGYFGGKLVTKGVSPSGYTTLILSGDVDYLDQVQIEISTTGESIHSSQTYWQALLDLVLPKNTQVVAEAQRYFPQAASMGKVEILQGDFLILLEATRTTMKLTLQSAPHE